ncbi:MAG: RHS repeat-associated core domain-containing protein [Chloroflexota bacterium]|nr:RHS repeat-associated core domain-containing protein [Chloroflexota bacterium]
MALYPATLSEEEIQSHFSGSQPSGGSETTTFVYDGDGNRVLKTENGETLLYVNQYYEKNLTTGEETSHYYLGGREIAYRNNDGLKYVHQDHLSGTSLTTDSSGTLVAQVEYFPFGEIRSEIGLLDTDKLFTGQRLDGTGLYYYNARYYDPTIGRFISADTIVPDWTNPQSLNRYSYCLNNPLRYTDPSGNMSDEEYERLEEHYQSMITTFTPLAKAMEKMSNILVYSPEVLQAYKAAAAFYRMQVLHYEIMLND